MSPIHMLLKSVVLPAAVAAVPMLLPRLLQRGGGVVAAVALAVGYAAGHVAVAWPAFLPLEVTDRLLWIAALALVGALIAAVTAEPARWTVALIVGQVAVSAVVGPILLSLVETTRGAVWAVAVTDALVLSWTNLDRLARRLTPGQLGTPLVVVALATAAALTVSGSIVAGQFAAALGAALISVTALGRADSLRACAGPVFSTLLGTLLIYGNIYSELPASAGLLIVASQAAPWAARIPALGRRPAWQSAAVAALLAAVPVGVAVALSFGEPSPYGE